MYSCASSNEAHFTYVVALLDHFDQVFDKARCLGVDAGELAAVSVAVVRIVMADRTQFTSALAAAAQEEGGNKRRRVL